MKAQFETLTGTSLFMSDSWNNTEQHTLYAGDIYHPWHSAHGFAVTAARLAAGQSLILNCREDEVVDLIARLNVLLARPEAIERACSLLTRLEQQTFQKLRRLLDLEDQPISEAETSELIENLEQLLAEPSTADRLEETLSSEQATEEIAGLRQMLARLQVLIPALEKVKESGFHVIVRDRRRQPVRPALEARRNDVIDNKGKGDDLPAGFLLPAAYHLTLWNYLVVRSDGGQSAVWN